jgi:murein DD-endopeptidase MepM/ murein hydrolase activator NlpD
MNSFWLYQGVNALDILILDKASGQVKEIKISKTWLVVKLLLLVVAFTCIGVGLGIYIYKNQSKQSVELIGVLKQSIDESYGKINDTKKDIDRRVSALSVKLADLQARLIRMDALGEKVLESANINDGEFDFSQSPALGGPVLEVSGDDAAHASILADTEAADSELADVVEHTENRAQVEQLGLISALDVLEMELDQRYNQLKVLDALLSNSQLFKDRTIAGRPITKGWLSSKFGYRRDPFTGKKAWHAGVDYAGKDGSDIAAVGSGVITWAGKRYGYGLLVEVNHGNGYSTRYAHCKEILVGVGQVVERGERLALMGSTGRSTGPHVHFEVRKNGKSIDPVSFINKKLPKD